MQIHELTQRHRTDEGFIDNLKATGQTLKKGYQQGGIGGAVKAGTSNQAFAQAQTDVKVARETDAYAKQLASQWKAQADQFLAKERSAVSTKSATAPAGAGTNATADVGRKVSRARPGQMSAAVAGSRAGQNLRKMFGAPRGGLQDMDSDLEEAFGDLPGSQPAVGNTEKVYARAFERWANEQLTTTERNSGKEINLNTAKQDYPELVSQLATALNAVTTSRADATANQEAVKNYLVTAMKGIQRVAARLRAENPRDVARSGVRRVRSVPGQMDPETEQMASAMGITNDNLQKMKSIVANAGETVRQGTGSNTIDNMLIAAGLLKA
jgi:hypothetical protein